jgi:hypothetical protein
VPHRHALADEFRTAADHVEANDGSNYCQYWLAALEKIVTAKGLVNRAALNTCNEAWAGAFRHYAARRTGPSESETVISTTSKVTADSMPPPPDFV